MLRQVIYSAAAMLITLASFASNPPHITPIDWTNAGNKNFFFNDNTLNFQNNYNCDYRGGAYNDAALAKAIADLGDEGGVVFLKAGVYLYKNPISLPSNVLLKGEGKNTVLTFDLEQATDAIQFNGSLGNERFSLLTFARKGENEISLVSTAGINEGDLLKIWLPESDLTTSDWAKGSIAQLVKVKTIKGNVVKLESELRLHLKGTQVKIAKVNPVVNAGVSCLEIIRTDATDNQTSNISFNYAENCFVKGVQSDYSNFAHVEINNSYKVQVSGSFFRYGHDYGRGGKAYGVVLQFGSSDCLVENNIFSTLRHSVLLQAGANGNVVGYNYSINPTWQEENLPENSAGDIVLHGNYPFANLFEGNIVQNIVVDASHGKNGPDNVFLKNTAELYGLFINPQAADSQVVIDNKITNRTFLLGNYYVFGEGHYEYGNKVRNKYQPANTTASDYESFYEKAGRYNSISDYRIVAEARYNNKNYTVCNETEKLGDEIFRDANSPEDDGYATSVNDYSNSKISLYPNPATNHVTVDCTDAVNVTVFDLNGKQVLNTNQKNITVSDWQIGVYYFQIESIDSGLTTYKKVLVN